LQYIYRPGSYYFQASLGIQVWWKKYLTQLQITQFILAVTACVGGLAPRWINTLGIADAPLCHGNYAGGYFGTAILASYLVLFIKMYHQKYDAQKKQKQQQLKHATSASATASAALLPPRHPVLGKKTHHQRRNSQVFNRRSVIAPANE
jgi:hypothetical protein